MKKIYYLFLLVTHLLPAQNAELANNKIMEGIQLHDAAKFDEALSKYNEALTLDKNNSFALSEKAMTLAALQKYEEAIETSKLILQLYPNEDNKTVYVTYGNALDHLGKPDSAIKIYDEGLKKHPKYFHLYFNKGITLYTSKKNEEAIKAFQASTKLNPNHSGSFNALSVLVFSNRISSILASGRYLVLDNRSARAKGNLDSIISLMKKGVAQNAENKISITIDENIFNNVSNNRKTENDFSTVDLALSMSAALDYDEANKNKTDIEKFAEKFKIMCEALDSNKKNQRGYFWEFLAPYFIEMKNKNLIEPYSNIIFLSANNADASEYYRLNPGKIEQFYNWSKNYEWK